MEKIRLTTEIRICNSTRCWNTIGNAVRANDGGERERERKTREGRREERKKEGRAHPPPPRPGGPLPPHRPFQPVHPFWVASLSHTRSAPTGPHPTRILNGCGERETGQGTTNGRTRHTPVLYRRSRIAYHLMKPGINNSEDLELGSNL
jgi:hypothetical protein